jgi:hypothetical protein
VCLRVQGWVESGEGWFLVVEGTTIDESRVGITMLLEGSYLWLSK